MSGRVFWSLPRRMFLRRLLLSDIEYRYIEDVKNLSAYRPGGYHPIQIADRLHNRYRIAHVAVKVGTAGADRREADILSQLRRGARCSLLDAKEASDPRLFQLGVARSLAAQLTMAVSLVHSQGYAHGDLHLGNLLLQLPSSLANLSVEQLQFVVRLDGKPISSGVPSHAIPPAWLGAASDRIALSEANLLLNDFGTTFRPSDKSRFESYTPLVTRPPEALFEPTTPLSFASLIDGILATQDDITAQQVHLQGPLPSEWWDRWEERSEWFDEAGKPLSNDCDIWTWDRRFEQWIQELRQSCGMDRPEARPNAEEVFNTAWMKKWALSAYEESRKGWA
ncbi:kinase-like domain-containing protein [Xylaria acuta]|nr:kinase-like domain-containing protein [Xylaria acuta]